MEKPSTKPKNPNFSSGPCSKRPGWSFDVLKNTPIGRSHRAKECKDKLNEVIVKSKKILGLPENYLLGIMTGSNTGALEAAMWSLLGSRGVDVMAWENFGKDWVIDVLDQPKIKIKNVPGKIYENPKFLPGGDKYMLIEFGNVMDLEINFKAQNLAQAIKNKKVKGVYETAPCFASMLVHYNPDEIKFNDLKNEVSSLIKSLGPTDEIEINSRVFSFPTVYLDKWTKECVDDYINKIAKKKPDPEFITELNNLEDTEQFVRVHSGTEYWVSSLGFWPGLPFMMPLDPRCLLTAPKYNPPRTWTPKGTVGMGGASTAIYPEALPGGYQIFGITPVPIWDTKKSFSVFENSICLFKPGDRVKFIPTDYEEFDLVANKIENKTFDYNSIIDHQKFSVKKYKAWLSELDKNKRF